MVKYGTSSDENRQYLPILLKIRVRYNPNLVENYAYFKNGKSVVECGPMIEDVFEGG